MSLIWAMQSFGISSYCLNWAKSPKINTKMRKLINLPNSYQIMMFVAYGYPDKSQNLCRSKRLDIGEYFL